MDLSAGSKVGRYTLDAYLGGGSFGAVWRARGEDGETVAVKLLTGPLSSAESSRMRGEIEMLAAAAVASRSPNVVKVLSGGSEPVPHIVMEYVEGMDLASLLVDGGILPVSRTLDVGLAIMDALRALDEAGVVHRDIKPANVMIDNQGVIKLADFGIAKIVGYESITMTGQAAMSMAYAAPEIWDEDGNFGRPSHKSDLYAAGIVLYQCLAGMTPFRGNYGALYKAHTERPADLTLLPTETPASLRSLIESCLAKRQEERPRDAGECLRRLQRATVELRERQGTLPQKEPRRFGAWLREAPHPTQPWAWRCRNEQTGESATVEVHSVAKLDAGAELRRVVTANSKLAAYGAERLLGTNRLLMAPDEAWQTAPAAEFQFWVARADDRSAPAVTLSLQALRRGILALDSLLATAAAEDIEASLGESLSLQADGNVYVARPGLPRLTQYANSDALASLKALSLDAEARQFAATARDFPDLVSRVKALTAEPVVVVDDESSSTILVPAAPEIAVADVLASEMRLDEVHMELRRAGSGKEYELVLHNLGAGPVELKLEASSEEDRLRVLMPPSVMLASGMTERLKVMLSSKERRWSGGKRATHFTVTASGNDGGSQPPLTAEGEYEEEPARLPLLAGGGLFGVAIIAALAVFALGGGGNASPNIDPIATPTAVEATATPLPPTATPEPPPPAVQPEAPAPIVPVATSAPRPVVVPSTSTPVPALPPAPAQAPPPTSTSVPAAAPPTQLPTCVPTGYAQPGAIPGAAVSGPGACYVPLR
jgi:hypothetical protein